MPEALGGRPPAVSTPSSGASEGGLDRTAARAAHAEALSLVERLRAIRGDGTLRCLLASLGEGRSFAEAVRAEAGLTPGELYAGWRRWAGV